MYYSATHQQTPKRSKTVAQHEFQGTDWMGRSTTPPSLSTWTAFRTASSLPSSKALKVMVSHFIWWINATSQGFSASASARIPSPFTESSQCS